VSGNHASRFTLSRITSHVSEQRKMHRTTTFYLVRHGHVHNPMDLTYGRLPRFGLSDAGRQQAQAAAEALRRVHVDAMYTSPLLRTRQTARIIRACHPGCELHSAKELVEVRFPYEGGPLQIVRDRDWDIYTGSAPEYEQPHDVLERIQAFVDRVRRQRPGQKIIAVTHGDLIAWLILWSQGIALNPGKKKKDYPTPGSVHAFEYRTTDRDEVPVYRMILP
jgi:broad specificity phosphatase PhoE